MTRFGGSSKKLDSNKSNFTNHFKDLTSPLHDPSALLPRNATPRRAACCHVVMIVILISRKPSLKEKLHIGLKIFQCP